MTTSVEPLAVTTAVWFDLDGTLVVYDRPGEPWFRGACERAGVRFREAVWERFQERFFELPWHEGDPYVRAAGTVVEEFDLDVAPESLAWGFVTEELADARTPDAVADLLADLSGERPVGVLTDGIGYVQRTKLDVCGLSPHPDAVLVGGETGRYKPDPGAFEAARERLPADRHVMVGDSPGKDAAAREAGFGTALVGEGGEDVEVDLRIEDHDEFGRIRELLD